MGIRGGTQQKNCGTACRPWTERGAEDAACGDRGAKQFCFEEFGYKIGDRHGTPAEQIKDAVFAETADVPPRLEKIPEILRRWRIDGWRSDRRDFREHRGNFFEGRGELREACGVSAGERW